MANEHAVPQESQEKTQGDMLEGVVNSATGEGKGSPQDLAAKAGEREPANEPLK